MKLVAAILLIPALAHADTGDSPPDPHARKMAAEANLEPTRRREGLALGVAIGPAMQIGLGLDNATGTGGSLDLRIGTSASDRLAWIFDVFYAGTRTDSTNKTFATSGLLTVGAQVFALETLWIRGGVGLGSLNVDGKAVAWGFGAFGGGGMDFLRNGRFALSGDLSFVSGAYADGFVTAAVFQVGLTWW